MADNKLQGEDMESVPPAVREILDQNAEALIIIANPDRGESRIVVFTKLSDDKSVISSTIVEILTNLMFTANKNAKCPT